MNIPIRPCNLDDRVDPNYFSAQEVQRFAGLSLDQEFDLVAPVYIFLDADLKYRAQARSALKRLVRLQHPLLDSMSVSAVLEGAVPDGLTNRYNALVMAIADDEVDGIQSHVDPWGAYAFAVGHDKNVLAGDSPGSFAYYMSAQLLRKRLQDALHDCGV